MFTSMSSYAACAGFPFPLDTIEDPLGSRLIYSIVRSEDWCNAMLLPLIEILLSFSGTSGADANGLRASGRAVRPDKVR